jgi:hypothetical protein
MPKPSKNTKASLRRRNHAFCPVCEKLVKLMSFSDSATAFKTDESDINQLAEKRQLHRLHNRRGKVMICADSLFRCFDNRQTRPLTADFLLTMAAKGNAK